MGQTSPGMVPMHQGLPSLAKPSVSLIYTRKLKKENPEPRGRVRGPATVQAPIPQAVPGRNTGLPRASGPQFTLLELAFFPYFKSIFIAESLERIESYRRENNHQAAWQRGSHVRVPYEGPIMM